MSWLEQIFISFALSVVRGLVKNPQHAETVKEQMLMVADDIYAAYGLVPPAQGGSAPVASTAP